jgi:hypothetical protein
LEIEIESDLNGRYTPEIIKKNKNKKEIWDL